VNRLHRTLFALTAAVAAAALVPGRVAHAIEYRWPTDGGNREIWGYVDRNGTGGVFQDFQCGTLTYDGHAGTDIHVPSGSNVYAAASGRVIRAATGYPNEVSTVEHRRGNHVVLWHGDGQETIYMHLSSAVVSAATWVTCGQLIGYSGRSGDTRCMGVGCDSSHLHFEARINVDARAYDNADAYDYTGSHIDPYTGSCGTGTSLWYMANNAAPPTACAPTQPTDAPPATTTGGGSSGGTPPAPTPTTADNAVWASDTLPDGTEVPTGSAARQTWTITNNGTTTWTAAAGYRLLFDNGDRLGGPAAVALPSSVAPGRSVQFTVNVTVPAVAGRYRGEWRMAHNNVAFGDWFWFEIVATSPATGVGATCRSATLGRTVQHGECVQVEYGSCGVASCAWQRCDNGRWLCLLGAACPGRTHANTMCGSGGGAAPGGCACRSGVDNFCAYGPGTTACPMTARGGYCDPNGDGSFADADWLRGFNEYARVCGSTPGTPSPSTPPPSTPPPAGSCACRSGVDNYCLLGVNVSGCPMTARGGYCDPNGDGSFADADWTRGYNEYRAACGGGSSPPPPPPPPASSCACRSGVDNYCLLGVNVAGCPMTAPGGYCDPNGDGSFADADWTRGYNEYRAHCP
jgi:murein DD-endopeptidase MepM/ murein hydrolase activator NlpD